jgi:hypothetical protein
MKTLNSIKNFSLSLIMLFGFIANANSMKVESNEII